jgi:hypothetical protein
VRAVGAVIWRGHAQASDRQVEGRQPLFTKHDKAAAPEIVPNIGSKVSDHKLVRNIVATTALGSRFCGAGRSCGTGRLCGTGRTGPLVAARSLAFVLVFAAVAAGPVALAIVFAAIAAVAVAAAVAIAIAITAGIGQRCGRKSQRQRQDSRQEPYDQERHAGQRDRPAEPCDNPRNSPRHHSAVTVPVCNAGFCRMLRTEPLARI